jgi:hypothetical protein
MTRNGRSKLFLFFAGKWVPLQAMDDGDRNPITASGRMEILEQSRLSPAAWVIGSSFTEQKIDPHSSSLVVQHTVYRTN